METMSKETTSMETCIVNKCGNARCTSECGKRGGLCRDHGRSLFVHLAEPGDEPLRWCQKCHKLHAVVEFSGTMHTCIPKALKHNERRRVSRPVITSAVSRTASICVFGDGALAHAPDNVLPGTSGSGASCGNAMISLRSSIDSGTAPVDSHAGAHQQHWSLRDIVWDSHALLAEPMCASSAEEDSLLLPGKLNAAEWHAESGSSGRRKRRPVGCALLCQADGCEVSLTQLSTTPAQYRSRLCATHITALEVMVNGSQMRYCQKCRRPEPVDFFTGLRHTCQAKLDIYSQRRRKRGDALVAVPPASADADTSSDAVLAAAAVSGGGTTSSEEPSQRPSMDGAATGDGAAAAGSLDAAAAESSPLMDAHDDLAIALDSIISGPARLWDDLDAFHLGEFDDDLGDIFDGLGRQSPPWNSLDDLKMESAGVDELPEPVTAILKLHSLHPTTLPYGLRHFVAQSLGQHGAADVQQMEGYVQPGCTLLTVQALRGRSKNGNGSDDAAGCALALAQALAASRLPLGSSYDVYFGGEMARVAGSSEPLLVSTDTALTPPPLPPMRPLAVLRIAASEVEAVIPHSVASTGASGSGNNPAVVGARFHGQWLRILANHSRTTCRLSLPAIDADGVLMLVPWTAANLAAPVPVLLCSNAAVVREINALAEAADAGVGAIDSNAAARVAIAVGHALHPGVRCPPALFAAAVKAVTRLQMPATVAAMHAAAADRYDLPLTDDTDDAAYGADVAGRQRRESGGLMGVSRVMRETMRLAARRVFGDVAAYVSAVVMFRRGGWRKLFAAVAASDPAAVAAALHVLPAPHALELRAARSAALRALSSATKAEGIFLLEHAALSAWRLLETLTSGGQGVADAKEAMTTAHGDGATAGAMLVWMLLRREQAAALRRAAQETEFQSWLAQRAFRSSTQIPLFLLHSWGSCIVTVLTVRAFAAAGGLGGLAEVAASVRAAPPHLAAADVLTEKEMAHFVNFCTLVISPMRLLASVLIALGVFVRQLRPWLDRNHQVILYFHLVFGAPSGFFIPFLAFAAFGRSLGMLNEGAAYGFAFTSVLALGVELPLMTFTSLFFFVKGLAPVVVFAAHWAGVGELRFWALFPPTALIFNLVTSALAWVFTLHCERRARIFFACSSSNTMGADKKRI